VTDMLSVAHIRSRLLPTHTSTPSSATAILVTILLAGLAVALCHAALASPVDHDDCKICQVLLHAENFQPAVIAVVLTSIVVRTAARTAISGNDFFLPPQRGPPLSL
jgi:hypothetical protein